MKLAVTASALACLVVWPIAARAQTINIVNPHFDEDPYDSIHWASNGAGNHYPDPFIVPHGWMGVGSVNVNYFESSNAAYPLGLPDGSYAVVCGPGLGSLYQDTDAKLAAGQTYTLTVDVGDRADYGGAGSIAINAVNGSSVTTLASKYDFAAPGTFDTVTVTYTATAADPYLGQTLEVWLGYAAGANQDQASFQDVRFSSAATPEPFTMALCAAGLGLAVARRRRRA